MRTHSLFLAVLSLVVGPVFLAQAKEDVDKTKEVQSAEVEAARAKAKLLHKIYESTLDAMHHRYFRNDRSTIPARVMEDIFGDIKREENISARWIAVNARAMNIKHRAETEFEKSAAKALSEKDKEYEEFKEGVYRRAQSIRLTGGCLTCHEKFGADPTTTRFAGLVISIPVEFQQSK